MTHIANPIRDVLASSASSLFLAALSFSVANLLDPGRPRESRVHLYRGPELSRSLCPKGGNQKLLVGQGYKNILIER